MTWSQKNNLSIGMIEKKSAPVTKWPIDPENLRFH